MKFLVDYTVFASILTGLEGYMDAFKWVNENVGEIATLDTIYIDTVEHSYNLLQRDFIEFGEVFLRLSNVLRSLVDSTVSEYISYKDYVEEAMKLSSEHDINPRVLIYYVAAKENDLIHVSMNRDIKELDNVLYIEPRDI